LIYFFIWLVQKICGNTLKNIIKDKLVDINPILDNYERDKSETNESILTMAFSSSTSPEE